MFGKAMKLFNFFTNLIVIVITMPTVVLSEVAEAGGDQVMIVPIDQPIMKPQLYIVRKGVQAAIDMDAAAIIFRMDTPGGSVAIMEEIVNNFIDIDIPTYTFVENQAISPEPS